MMVTLFSQLSVLFALLAAVFWGMVIARQFAGDRIGIRRNRKP